MPEKCLCVQCNRTTNHVVLKEIKNDLHDDEGWWEENLYQTIQCAGCEQITFRKRYTDVSMYAYDIDSHYYTDELYPKRDINTRAQKIYLKI